MGAADFRSLPDDADVDSSEALALDPSTLTGTLENGLRYYIGHAPKPKGRVAMALAVCIGSVVEEEHERGVAHILEHLAFNATEKYSNHDIVKFLESIGAEFGACQNAHTTFDETVYELLVPLKDIEKGLSVFAQFAAHIRCDAEDLRKERGAVLDEWRNTRSAESRAFYMEWKVMCADCKYADRLPIGLESVIRNVSADTIKAFYKKWYTAENMAVIVMGDISDPEGTLRLVKEHLEIVPSAGPNRTNKPERILLPPHRTPRYVIFKDKEHQEPSLQVIFQREAPELSSALDLKKLTVEKLLHTAFSNRLFKLSRIPDPPFYGAGISGSSVTKTIYSGGVVAVVEENGHEQALETILIELARVQQHGVTQLELDAAKSQELSEAESCYMERDQAYATELRAEYERHFTSGELVVGRKKEASLVKTILQKIELEDLLLEARNFTLDQNCVIKATSYQSTVSQKALEGVVAKVEKLKKDCKIEPSKLVPTQLSILDSIPSPGKIISSKELPYAQAKEFILENGCKVCLKSTKHLGDQVLVSGYALGGLSELSQEEFQTCSYAFKLAGEIGQFGHPPEALTDALMGKRVELGLGCTAFAHSFAGEQSPGHMETAFQLIHRLFTHDVLPSHGDLTTGLKYLRDSIQNEQRNPMTVFYNKVRFINRNKSYLYEPLTVEALERMDPELAFNFYNNCFKNPAQFTICVTGSIEEEELVPLVEQYLASIPKVDAPLVLTASEVKPAPDDFPEGVTKEDVRTTMIAPQGVALITVPVTIKIVDGLIDQEELFAVLFCSRLIETRLVRLLRFKHGEVYNVGAGVAWRSSPGADREHLGELSITFTCEPSSASRLTHLAFTVLEDLQEKACEQEELDALLNIEQREKEEQEEENPYWHGLISLAYASRYYRKTEDLDGALERRDKARDQFRRGVTPFALLQAYKTYFPFPVRSRYTVITFSPRLPILARLALKLSSQNTRVLALYSAGLCTAILASIFAFKRWYRR